LSHVIFHGNRIIFTNPKSGTQYLSHSEYAAKEPYSFASINMLRSVRLGIEILLGNDYEDGEAGKCAESARFAHPFAH
jgi:hypothetical protein